MITYMFAATFYLNQATYIKTELTIPDEKVCISQSQKLLKDVPKGYVVMVEENCTKWKIDENTGIGVKI